ncbi:MAG: hypothetical protein AAF577_07305 [Pseudomonadota bacterium]
MTHRRDLTERLKRPGRAALLATLALGLAACAQGVVPTDPAFTGGENPLAGINENRALGSDLKIANGICLQRTAEERGFFITNPNKCLSVLEHRQ